jgi:hypothetical protein
MRIEDEFNSDLETVTMIDNDENTSYYQKDMAHLLKSCMERSLMYSPVVISELRSGITGVPKYIIILQLSM